MDQIINPMTTTTSFVAVTSFAGHTSGAPHLK